MTTLDRERRGVRNPAVIGEIVPLHVVLYDGHCGICSRSVQFILEHDRRSRLSFATLEGPTGDQLRLRRPDLRHTDSVILVENLLDPDRENIWTRSSAAIRIAGHLGGWWRLFRLFRWIPDRVRDYLYDLVARYRYRVFGRLDRCWVPSDEYRRRFLDLD